MRDAEIEEAGSGELVSYGESRTISPIRCTLAWSRGRRRLLRSTDEQGECLEVVRKSASSVMTRRFVTWTTWRRRSSGI